MGAENSKPTSENSQYVFAADAPVRFSNELVDSLQNSTQSDSTRSRNLEFQIQSRVTSELEKLQAQESAKLSTLSESLSAEPEPASDSSPSIAERIGDTLSGSEARAERQRQRDISRDSVSKEIGELKRKLGERKKLDQVDAAVGKAKEEVVACLRKNDRRPLDCWKEVEAFRREVGRLEKVFVEKTIG
ncbi:DUF1690-domain-containing protein [Lepidopterella palustris CBS 459.81]|uniref:DUF1690-domain-containing protein n=1 Tax=Lepidopterella palustris CBS 459.81 TaxID=1314670 RepID=A0A8E2JE34_9PEZI|nr:DUF1690-domain-containing protein [Lepidopterella palustris CBS 459.81]